MMFFSLCEICNGVQCTRDRMCDMKMSHISNGLDFIICLYLNDWCEGEEMGFDPKSTFRQSISFPRVYRKVMKYNLILDEYLVDCSNDGWNWSKCWSIFTSKF